MKFALRFVNRSLLDSGLSKVTDIGTQLGLPMPGAIPPVRESSGAADKVTHMNETVLEIRELLLVSDGPVSGSGWGLFATRRLSGHRQSQ